MTAPFRTGLPKPPLLEALERPRLVEILEGRFERRLTVVQAGAGFGKTTALTQAVSKNLQEPYGLDLWMTCRSSDDLLAELSQGICVAVGASPSKRNRLRAIADALWKVSPQEVALILDDAHHVRPGGEAAKFLEELIEELPDNAHLVIASREPAPMPTTRLEAAGEAAFITEEDLAFRGEELTAFFAMRQLDVPVGDLGGWPALCELAAASRKSRVGDYLWEEVLAGLSERRRRDLARLASLDWIDADRIEAFTGRREVPTEFLQGLPLTRIDEDGNARLHGLWQQALAETDPAWNDSDLEQAWRALLEQEHPSEALDLCLKHGSAQHVGQLATHLAIHSLERVESGRLDAVLERLPESLRAAPLGQLLEGKRKIRGDSRNALPLLESAYEAFQANGQHELAWATLRARSVVAYSLFDAPLLRSLVDQARQADHAESPAMVRMNEATCAFTEGRPLDALQWIEKARGEGVGFAGLDSVVAAGAAMAAGLPERTLEEVELALPRATPSTLPLLIANRFDAMWALGKISERALAAMDQGPASDMRERANQASTVAGALALQNAVLGRMGPAREHLRRSEAGLEVAHSHGPGFLLAARWAIALQDGDEEGAQALIDEVVGERQPREFVTRPFLRGIPMALVVSERMRSALADQELGPIYEPGRRAALALAAFRDGLDIGPARDLPWDAAHRLRVFFVRRQFLELAVIAASAGSTAALAVARGLADHDRDVLGSLARKKPTAEIAKHLLSEVAARPPGRWELRVLGPMTLVHDGVDLQGAGIRRDRVRAILHYLAAHRNCTRDELAAALWPDLDGDAAINNLRVNLSHLLKVLEPDRKSGEPSYFVSSSGDTVRLAAANGLILDADAFEALLDRAEAADQAGDPLRTLQSLEEGLAMYRGDFLADAPDSRWGAAERTRLQSRYLRGALRAASLQLAVGETDAALEWALRARERDALSEQAIRLEALVYLRTGQRSAARRALQRALEDLAAEGVEPESETRRLAKRVGLAG